MAWELLNPALQIMVYWLVFGLGIRSNNPVHGIPFVFWLLVGISMWFFINQGVLEGTKSISQKFNQVAKMNFPLSIIPTYIVTSRFYGHIGLLAIIIVACMFRGITIYSYHSIIDLCAVCLFINGVCCFIYINVRYISERYSDGDAGINENIILYVAHFMDS